MMNGEDAYQMISSSSAGLADAEFPTGSSLRQGEKLI